MQSWWARRSLRSSNESSRLDAVRSLDPGDPDAIPLLGSVLLDHSDRVADEAATRLARQRSAPALQQLGAAIQRLLIERTLPNGFCPHRRLDGFVVALGEFGAAALPLLMAVVQNRAAELAARTGLDGYPAAEAAKWLGAQHYAPAIAALCDLVADPDIYARWHAAEALASIAHPAAAPALEARLTDESGEVRRAAGRGLAALGWKPGTPALAAAQAAARADVSEAVRLGAIAVAPLLREITGRYPRMKPPSRRERRRGGVYTMDDVTLQHLPYDSEIEPLVEALATILEAAEAAVDLDLLDELSNLPDLRVQYMAEYLRFDEGTGYESPMREKAERRVSCERLRVRAGALRAARRRVL